MVNSEALNVYPTFPSRLPTSGARNRRADTVAPATMDSGFWSLDSGFWIGMCKRLGERDRQRINIRATSERLRERLYSAGTKAQIRY